jgi:hypothetical protein
LAVECKKTFLDIFYGSPVIVMRRVASFKKTTLRTIWENFAKDNFGKSHLSL